MCGVPKATDQKNIANDGGGQIIKNEHGKFDRRSDRKLAGIYPEGLHDLVNPVVSAREGHGELGRLRQVHYEFIDAGFDSAGAVKSFEVLCERRPRQAPAGNKKSGK